MASTPVLTTLQLTAPSILNVGESVQLAVRDVDQFNSPISTDAFTSFPDPPTVAVVASAGVLTAVKLGRTVVSVSEGGVAISVNVDVIASTATLRLSLNTPTFVSFADAPFPPQPTVQLLRDDRAVPG
jgi:hypothetical protein